MNNKSVNIVLHVNPMIGKQQVAPIYRNVPLNTIKRTIQTNYSDMHLLQTPRDHCFRLYYDTSG
jgi:hypothetical protein